MPGWSEKMSFGGIKSLIVANSSRRELGNSLSARLHQHRFLALDAGHEGRQFFFPRAGKSLMRDHTLVRAP